VRQRERRVTYLPHQRVIVNDAGLAGFNIGKMFKRAVTFKKHSFDFKNILGEVGSLTSNVLTAGGASILAGKTFGAHGKGAQFIGGALVPAVGLLPKSLTGMTSVERLGSGVSLAVGAAVAGGVALAHMLPSMGSLGGGGFFSGVGSFLSGGGKLLGGLFGGMFGGAGGGGTNPNMYMQPQQIVPQQDMSSMLQQPDPNAVSQAVAQSGGANYGMQNTAYPTMPDATPGSSYPSADPSTEVPGVYSPTSAQIAALPKTDYTYYYVGGVVALAGLYYYYSK
jgi:hypothetical protein